MISTFLIFLYIENKKSSVHIFSNEQRQGDPLHWQADILQLTQLGYQPKTSLEDGLKSNQRELLEQKNQLKSRWVMTAGGDEPVYDAEKGENSLFVKYFLNALESVTTPITAMQLFDGSIKSNVGLNSKQVPTYTQIQNVDSRGGEFIFARSKN